MISSLFTLTAVWVAGLSFFSPQAVSKTVKAIAVNSATREFIYSFSYPNREPGECSDCTAQFDPPYTGTGDDGIDTSCDKHTRYAGHRDSYSRC